MPSNRFSKNSISTKLTLVVTVIFSLLVIAGSVFSYIKFKEMVFSNAQSNLSKDVRQMVRLIEGEFKNRYLHLSSFEKNDTLRTGLKTKNFSKIQTFVETITSTYRVYLGILVFDSSGEIVAQSFLNKKPDSEQSRIWFEQTKHEGQIHSGIEFSADFERPVINFATKIETDRFLGSIQLIYDATNMQTPVQDMQDFEKKLGHKTKHFFVIDSGGDVVVSEDPSHSFELLKEFSYDSAPHIVDEKVQVASITGDWLIYQSRGEAFDKRWAIDWIVVAAQSKLEAFGQANKMAKTLLFLWIGTLFVMAIVVSLAIGKLIRPLSEFDLSIKNILKTGSFSSDLPVQSEDEVGSLIRSFNELMKNLSASTETLKKQNQLFESVIESMGDGLLVGDKSGILLVSNSNGRKYGGLERSQKGKKFAPTCFVDRKTGEQVKEEQLPIRRVLRGERVENLQLEVLNSKAQSGTVVSATATPMKSASGEIIAGIVVFRDITENIQAEEKLSEVRQQVILNDKMAAIGTMAGGIAHEINNPLAIILNGSELLLEIAEDEGLDEFRETLEEIVQTAGRISRIVKGLKVVSRDGSGDALEPIQVGNLVENVMSLCIAKVKEADIQFEILETEDSTLDKTVAGRESQIVQVLLNLVTNSMDAIFHQKEKWIGVRVSEFEELIKISVMDNGPGVPKDVAAKIMTPFFTTKEVGKGTGLGLSISRSIMKDHGGDLFLENSSGACFSITLKKAEFETIPKAS